MPEDVSQPARVLPPEPPLHPWRATSSVWLGLLGMVLYAFALHLAFKFTRQSARADLPPVLAAVGCALFIAGVLLVWRIRLSTLLMLAAGSGVLIWLVTLAQESRAW